ncbi:MAG: glutamate--cysteine ligase, partial [Bdellovibrionota bacterium]
LKIDPWILTVDTTEVAPVDFNEDQGIEECALVVDATIARIAKEYADRKITSQPVVFIKSNAGTYGMGIHVVKSGEEIRKINRRVKNKLSVGKNRSAIKSVIVQEGITTITRIEGFTAEPVIYLVGRDLVGGFLRTNPQKNAEENLNSQG